MGVIWFRIRSSVYKEHLRLIASVRASVYKFSECMEKAGAEAVQHAPLIHSTTIINVYYVVEG